MKYLIILILLVIISSCDKTPNAALFDHNSSLAGYVIFEDSSPDSVQADIQVFNDQETMLLAETQTNPAGYYSVDRLAGGIYQVKITAENFSIHNFTDLILPANSSTILDTVNLFAPNSSLEGYVNFQDASPDTVSANVFLYYQNEVDAVATSQTDTTGFFRFDLLFAGLYELRISADNYEDRNITDIELLGHQTTIIDTIELELIEPMEFKEIVIDGEIDDGWESAYVNDHASSWSESNNFENLYIARDNENLYIAVDGGFDSGGNTVNIYFDIDYGNGTGTNDFTEIYGGTYGDHLRKNIFPPSNFRADYAFSVWAVSSDIGVVSLEDTENVDQNIIDTDISLNNSVIEIALPFSEIFPNGEYPLGNKIAVIAIIGSAGGGDYTSEGCMSNDTIPQQLDIEIDGNNVATEINFTTVFSRAY